MYCNTYQVCENRSYIMHVQFYESNTTKTTLGIGRNIKSVNDANSQGKL